MTDQTEPQTLCRTCMTPIGYIAAPTGGWWAHETHPADEHDAVPGGWVDGDELMEEIAAAVWEHCRTEDTSLVVDDPRNIAGTAAAVARRLLTAAAPSLSPAADQATLRDRIAEALADATGARWPVQAFLTEADAVLSVLPETARLHDQILVLQAELASGRDLLRTENQRANSAIDRETTAEEAEGEHRLALSEALGLGTGAPWDAIRERVVELRRLADETQQPETPDAVAAIVAALQERAGELSGLAEEQMRPSLEERAQEWHEAVDVARRAAKAAAAMPAPFTPPAHYRRDDGVDCCVHTIPVGPDSCPACRELHDDEQPAAAAQQPKEARP